MALRAQSNVPDAFDGIYPVTDKTQMQSLNGSWSLKVVDGITEDRRVPEADASWGRIPVPGNWEQYGFCKARYSFPDALTGYYRTEFTVPAGWKGQRVILRLDGVLRGYDLWINGRHVGTWEQPYNTRLFDLTPYLDKKAFQGGKQQLAMRVYSQYAGYEFDCYDDWAPMGIFRDVTLFCVPQTHLGDLTVEATPDGKVRIKADVVKADRHTSVEAELFDAQGRQVGSGLQMQLADPRPWTAETPCLYTLRVRLTRKGETLQTFEQKVGLRELTIDGKILKLNGVPVKLRGVTSHATDPVTVKVISEERTLQDMKLMKEASVNYIRTSHYPREPRFYELADSLGFYVIDEVPFGSRGKKLLEKEEVFPQLLTRTQATIRRDKNHACVLIWSLGNENPLPQSCVLVGEYARSLDPTRPVCYPQIGSYFTSFDFQDFPEVAGIYAPHYPTTGQMADFYQKTDRPVIFTEYCHTLGISFEDHDRQWEIIERTPALAGGSVWEWVDQGMPFRAHLDGLYGYEERVFTSREGGFEMSGNLGTDGLLYADRTLLPNYFELQHNYAQACVTDSLWTGTLHVRNRYDFVNLKDRVTFHWALTADRDTVASGAFSPDCPPHTTVPYALALPEAPAGKLALLQIEVRSREGLTLLRQCLPVSGTQTVGLRAASGLAPASLPDASWVRVGRKQTMAEGLKVSKERVERYLQPLDNPYVRATVEQADGEVRYTLTPVAGERRFLSEVGIAFLLPAGYDRVQWIGQGPFAAYPGRLRADRYGFWALHKDDLYFEGNRPGVEALWVSDASGEGLLLVCEGKDVNFEQTDRGLVLTVNAAVSGEGPKFSQTAFGVWSDKLQPLSGGFRVYRTQADAVPALFAAPERVPAPFHPFVTQYDTYLMRLGDVLAE